MGLDKLASQHFKPETQKQYSLPADIANITSDNNQLSVSLSDDVTSGPKMHAQTGKQQVKNII